MHKVILLVLLTLMIACTAGSIKRLGRVVSADENITCNNIISVSKPWLGVPYKYGGTDYAGVDCSGFVQQIYQQVFGIDLPRTTQEMFAEGAFVRTGWLSCADLLFFKNVRGAGVDHVGIYIGNNKFVHASTSQGVVISDLTSDYYSEHFVSARRF
jgi:murein DD-endopeptidase / murein LD-carboxypeptidase